MGLERSSGSRKATGSSAEMSRRHPPPRTLTGQLVSMQVSKPASRATRLASTLHNPAMPPPPLNLATDLLTCFHRASCTGLFEDGPANVEICWQRSMAKSAPLGSAPARLLCLLRARLTALAGSALPGQTDPLVISHCLGCSSEPPPNPPISPPLTIQATLTSQRPQLASGHGGGEGLRRVRALRRPCQQ